MNVSSQPRSNSEDGTASRGGKSVSSHNSTPDMTHTSNPNDHENPKLSGTTHNPFVPDGALAPSPDRNPEGTGLPHPFEDEYAAFESDGATGGGPPFGSANNRDGGANLSDAPPLLSEASYNGNPFVASSDDERAKRDRVRRIKASSPPKTVSARQSTTPNGTAKPSPPPSTSPVRQFNDFDDNPFGGAAQMSLEVDDATINGVGGTVAGDPFAQVNETTLEKTNTALQDDPFTDEGYYRTLAAEGGGATSPQPPNGSKKTTPVPLDDPFAHFGSAPFDPTPSGDGGQALAKSGSILRTDGSILRRSSQYGPEAQRKQEAIKQQGKPRRQSVALALSQAKPKQRAEEMAGPIDVVGTMPISDQRAEEEGRRRTSTGEYSAEDAASVDKAAEQLFMPSMKREQYIPVRVAREKIKLILSEMAQTKLLHLSAIDTMEKQHQFLKAQLETACAAYCRKLTADYNNRVVALNMEYKKRLAAVGRGGQPQASVSPSPASPVPSSTPPIPVLANSPSSEVQAKVQHLEAQLAAKESELAVAAQNTHECLERADEAEERLKESREQIRLLKIEVERLSSREERADSGPSRSPPPPGSSAAVGTEQEQQVRELTIELQSLKMQLECTVSIVEADMLRRENEELRQRVLELESEMDFRKPVGGGGNRMAASESAYNF